MQSTDKNMSPMLVKYLNWYLFEGARKPTNNISDARWAAIIKHLHREYVEPMAKRTI